MKYIDLHTHSYYSDGTDSPKDLVIKAAEAGLSTIALTDHDTLRGFEEAEEQAKKSNIRVIKGIEISSYSENFSSIHMLGLFIKDSTKLLNLEEKNHNSRRIRLEKILCRLNQETGINIRYENLSADCRGVIGGGNLIQYFANHGYAKDYEESNKFLRPFFEGLSYGVPVQEAIEVIHEAGGLAFVAHPYFLNTSDDGVVFEAIKDLKAMGLDGVESLHGDLPDDKVSAYLSIAEELGLLVSGGSDYHGAFKPKTHLGKGKKNKFLLDESYLEKIESKL